jgi:ribosomal protein L29
MTLPAYKEIEETKTVDEIEKEIFLLQKNLFELRFKRSNRKEIKCHLFVHAKRRIAQFQYKKSQLQKQNFEQIK